MSRYAISAFPHPSFILIRALCWRRRRRSLKPKGHEFSIYPITLLGQVFNISTTKALAWVNMLVEFENARPSLVLTLKLYVCMLGLTQVVFSSPLPFTKYVYFALCRLKSMFTRARAFFTLLQGWYRESSLTTHCLAKR